MADFIAVIRRAVDGLSNNTPEMRVRVYEKARAAVVRQLENMSPRPPEHMLQRQLDKLDAAILEVEAEHAEALPAIDEVPVVAEEPPEAAGTADMATTGAVAASSPAWAEPVPAAEEEPAAGPEDAQALPEAVQPVNEPVETYAENGPSVTGDDWADAHMAEPAAEPEPQPEPESLEVYRAEPVQEPEPVADDAAPVDAGWRVEPTFGADDPDTDYERLYDDRPEEPVAAAPESPAEVEAPAEAEPFQEAPTAEETWSQQDEPEPTTPAWAVEPPAEPEAAEPERAEPEPLAAEVQPEPEPDLVAPSPAAAVPVDSVDDWLQSRAQDPLPTIPAASWDPPVATETAANRVPEVPEIDMAPAAVSYTPTDEFPAYEEPVRVEASHDFLASEGLSLPDADPATLGTIGEPPAAANIEPDDFSQWFQDHAEEAKASPREGDDGSAQGASLAPTEWDEHIDSFAPSAKGAQVDVAAGQADGMETLVSGYGQQPSYRLEPKKRRNLAPLIIGGLIVALLAGGGYLAWSMRDDIGSMVANLTGEIAPAEETTAPPATMPAGSETPAEPVTEEAATPPAAATAADQKFTQRLRPDGTEIDEGAGSAPIEGAPAEGRSVSAQTVASAVEPSDAPAAANGAAATQSPATSGDAAAIAGGEKLFLYEERIGQATPVAVPGSISWTAVRENGADGRPDPQIQGRINVPERGITALLTIKRNTDNSLPASHIIEVVFSVPPDFEGGAIENLQRIAMKRTEQDRGDPLVAVTAKVTDDTYLVALNDFEDVVKRNVELLSTRGWMDIPLTYRNGRRALITLDKGTTGGNVFEQVLREWAALTPAAPAN
ncbi:hypothetical protein [Rhizobium sp. 'Codium 1']|uniref:hypothetical protein n=1 Tax=Rhizobium sp. 'Codium 1' TaxID=2940484 RepID=UPI001E58A3E0|nr:hypothetical protein [Rhizobium sp. 'Codium 1']MCC8932358.1 hypothetical protein [Rhizobium sp. 'Codium 1']